MPSEEDSQEEPKDNTHIRFEEEDEEEDEEEKEEVAVTGWPLLYCVENGLIRL